MNEIQHTTPVPASDTADKLQIVWSCISCRGVASFNAPHQKPGVSLNVEVEGGRYIQTFSTPSLTNTFLYPYDQQ